LKEEIARLGVLGECLVAVCDFIAREFCDNKSVVLFRGVMAAIVTTEIMKA
jgi:hypothetical protein